MCLTINKDVEYTLTKDNYRTQLSHSLEEAHRKLYVAVNSFNAKKAVVPINREALDGFETMVWYWINDKVRIRKRKNRFIHYISFDTEMDHGGEFGEHFHEDLIESAEVISGEMIDKEDGKIYKAGDVAHYEKGVKHIPVATKKTVLHVLFKP